jgi:hypothetical protein
VKVNTTVGRVNKSEAGAERIRNLEEELARAPVSSRERRMLTTAIRNEAEAYRKALDTEQATATHDARTQPTRKTTLVSPDRSDRRGGSSSQR